MLLSTIASIFFALLITQGTLAALTPQQVVVNINTVATISADANTALSPLSTSSTPSEADAISRVSWVPCLNGTILTRFPEQALVASFQKIINSLTGDVTAMQATPPFVDAVTQPIVDSLTHVSTDSWYNF